MAARNTSESFGWITRGLHWMTALFVLAALPLGLWIARMDVTFAAIKYFSIHKTLGFTVLVLTVLRLIWHWISPPPPPIPSEVTWQDRLAKLTHRAFYVVLIAMPIAGWVASSATGINTVVYGALRLPNIAPNSVSWEVIGFAIHKGLGWLLMALLALHIAGALVRSLVKQDGTLGRMIRG